MNKDLSPLEYALKMLEVLDQRHLDQWVLMLANFNGDAANSNGDQDHRKIC